MSSHDPYVRKEEPARPRTRAETPPPSFWRRWLAKGGPAAEAISETPAAAPAPDVVPPVISAEEPAPDPLAAELAALDPLADAAETFVAEAPAVDESPDDAPADESVEASTPAAAEPPPASPLVDDPLAHELAAFELPIDATTLPAPGDQGRIVIERVYVEDIVVDREVVAPVVLGSEGVASATGPAPPDLIRGAEPVADAEAEPAEPSPQVETQPPPRPAEPASEAPAIAPTVEAKAEAESEAKTEAETADDIEDDAPQAAADTRPRVLIVEDDRGQALFAQSVLHGAGLLAEVETAADNVLDAIARFDPDLVLMDLHLPGSNGLTLTRSIRAQPHYLHLPIVFLSGDPDPEREYEVLLAGADDFLTKPVRPRHLIAAVSNRIERARSIRSRHPAPPAPAATAASAMGTEAAPPSATTPTPANPPPLTAQLIDATLGDATVELAFQPIVATAGSDTAQFQVLLRLRRPDGALVTAAQAVPAAELAGRIVELDRQVVEHSLDLLARRAADGAPLRLFVSQSPRSLASADAAARLMRAIDARGVDPSALVIELRLADALAHTALLRRFCQPLTTAGVQFSLTQYEHGPEAEAILGRLPLSYLRLSQRYAHVHVDPALDEQVRATVALARRHGLRTIAQQVEDARAAARLRALGVDFLQGNLMQEVGRGLGFDFRNPVP